MKSSNISMNEVLSKCEDTINIFRKRKKIGSVFKRVILGVRFVYPFEHGTTVMLA